MNNFNCWCCRNFILCGFVIVVHAIFKLVYIVYIIAVRCALSHSLTIVSERNTIYLITVYVYVSFQLSAALSFYHFLFDCTCSLSLSLSFSHYRCLRFCLFHKIITHKISISTHVLLKIQCKLPFDHNSML